MTALFRGHQSALSLFGHCAVFERDNDPPPPPADRPPRNEWDPENDDEAPETPLDEPPPLPIQDPPPEPRVPLVV